MKKDSSKALKYLQLGGFGDLEKFFLEFFKDHINAIFEVVIVIQNEFTVYISSLVKPELMSTIRVSKSKQFCAIRTFLQRGHK